jgi:5-methylcytosine-specific restriction protein A
VLLLFTGSSGEAFGYDDGWTDDGYYRYFGEGQVGDMEFIKGNKAIRDHAQDGNALYLFRIPGKRKKVRSLGEFHCVSWGYAESKDRTGATR